MTTLQFSLFFVALLVGYILVHIRLARFEEHMQKLSGIRLLDDRVKLMAESLDKLTVEGVESRLDSLRESLEVLAEVTARMQEAMSQAAQPAATTVVAADGESALTLPAAESPAARVLAITEARLLQLGYGNIRILTDVTGVADHGAADVQVECERGGMLAKGQVQVRNFSVRDVALQTVAPMFP